MGSCFIQISFKCVLFFIKFSCYNSTYNCTNALALLIIKNFLHYFAFISHIHSLTSLSLNFNFTFVVSFLHRKCVYFFLLLFSLVTHFVFIFPFFFLLANAFKYVGIVKINISFGGFFNKFFISYYFSFVQDKNNK